MDESGRVETIWFPFTSAPWLKVWTVAPQEPLLSREVTTPYNYVFSDPIPQSFSDLIKAILDGDVSVTPTFGQAELEIVAAGLLGTLTADIWGWAKDLLLYVKPTTLRVTANGYAVLTSRSNIQQVIYDFTIFYQSQVAAYQAQGNDPMNGPVEIRVTGLDSPSDVEITGALSPQLSALRPRPHHPDWNVAVWFDILTMPGTPYSDQFYRDIEQWMFSALHRVVMPRSDPSGPRVGPTRQALLGLTPPRLVPRFQTPSMLGRAPATICSISAGDPRSLRPSPRSFSNAFLDVFMP